MKRSKKAALFIGFVIVNAIFWIGEVKFGVLTTVDLKTHQYLAKLPTITVGEIMTGKEEVPDGCPKGPIIVSELGNWNLFEDMIWEYSGVWGLAKYLNRTGYVPQTVLSQMLLVFPDLTLLPYEDIEHCNISLVKIQPDNTEPLETLVNRTNGSSLLFAKNYVFPLTMLQYLEEAKSEFRFNSTVLDRANETLLTFRTEGRTIVGVHLRRSRYYKEMLFYTYEKRFPANASFYLDAMEWYRKNVGGRFLFIISCDDVQWTLENVAFQEDVVVVPRDDLRDLALLSQVDHLVLDYGNIGAWSSMFSNGYILSVLPFTSNDVMTKYKKWVVFDDAKYMDRVEKFE